MRPKITYDILKNHNKALFSIFVNIATSEDFKKVFHAQAFGKAYGLKDAVTNHTVGNPTLTKKIEDYANIDENWKVLIKEMTANKGRFDNLIIPSRNSDFYVAKEYQETFFWVDERIEITLETKTCAFYIAKLIVDEKSDCLLFNNGEDGWVEYGGSSPNRDLTFSQEVAKAYENYLADKQILKD